MTIFVWCTHSIIQKTNKNNKKELIQQLKINKCREMLLLVFILHENNLKAEWIIDMEINCWHSHTINDLFCITHTELHIFQYRK